jgi:predicted RNase H-like HicB family nuclease
MHYVTFVFTDAGGYGFVAPDVEGFTAHVETEDFDEAVSEARRVLASHLTALLDAGGSLPPARSLADLKRDPALEEDFGEAAALVMLPALVSSGRTKRVNLSLDENTLSLIDRAAQERGLTRSAFVAEAARELA